MVKPSDVFKIKGALDKFTANHPKFPAFLQAASQGMLGEGTIVDMTVTSPDGRKIATNVKLTESDIELVKQFTGKDK